jgi:deoxyadenosine/deoxycytidine kinase
MYIVISGTHGIGKTTLARNLAEKLGADLLTESIDEAILPPVLGTGGDPLKAELWFVRQMILKEAQMKDTTKIYVADRGWADIYAYANVVLDEHARNLFRSVMDHMPKRLPDVHLVVHAPKDIVIKRIRQRGRSTLAAWNELDEGYLERVINEFCAYHEAFKDLRPLYLIDASGSIEENLARAFEAVKPHLNRLQEKMI